MAAVRFRRQLNATALAIVESDGRTEVATITAGEGEPTADAPDGSLYLRTDATTGDDVVYARIAGAWVALAGA